MALGISGVIAVIALRYWEMQQHRRIFRGVRRQLDSLAVRLAEVIDAVPAIIAYALRALGQWMYRSSLKGLARCVVVLQWVVRMARIRLYQRTKTLRTSRTASQFLSHIAEHKRHLTKKHAPRSHARPRNSHKNDA